MAEEKKKFSLGGIDNAAEEKGSFMKTGAIVTVKAKDGVVVS